MPLPPVLLRVFPWGRFLNSWLVHLAGYLRPATPGYVSSDTLRTVKELELVVNILKLNDVAKKIFKRFLDTRKDRPTPSPRF